MEEKKCEEVALFRYTWPGKDESFVCLECYMKLKAIANAIGLHLQIIQLSEEESLSGLTCSQIIK